MAPSLVNVPNRTWTEADRARRPYGRHGDARLSEPTVSRVSSSTVPPQRQPGSGARRYVGEPGPSAGPRHQHPRRATLLRRLSGRWLCSNCHASYHTVFSAPTTPGVCDRGGGELYQRVDDRGRPRTPASRSTSGRRSRSPTTELHQILVEVNGDQPIADVTRSLREALPRNNGTM